MRKLILFCYLALITISSQAQAPNFAWAKQTGGTGDDRGNDIAIDGSGNSYVTGSFSESATFGNTTLTSSGGTDIFIAKYDASGTLIWVTQAGGVDYETGNSIAIDGSGNSYVTGYFSGSATFGNTTLTTTNRQDYDFFIAKYDALGMVVWVTQAGAVGITDDGGSGLAIDGSGNSYVTGYFSGSATFGNTTLTSSGGTDIFIAKYDASGTMFWAKKAGGITDDVSSDIALDGSGNCYITGYFSGSATFDNTTLTSSGGMDIFIAKYDASGTMFWAKKAGGTAWDASHSIAIDISGNSYITGYFQQSVVFGSTTLVSNHNQDIFVAKYDASGTVLWAKQFGGIYTGGWDTDTGNDITIDIIGNLYVTGSFMGNITFGSSILVSNGNDDIFVAKYSAAGTVLWAKQVGGSDVEAGYSIALDGSGTPYLTGIFYGNATFGSDTLVSSGGGDIFVAKINSATNTLTTGLISPAVYCQGSPMSVPFTATGTFNPGNVFTAQLSDASGSFANSVAVGTLTSVSSGTIAATIPSTTPAGTGYRIRVIASNPSTIGTDNGTNITINAVAAVPTVTPSSVSICSGSSTSLSASSSTPGATYTWYSSAAGTTVLGTGASFTTPVLSASATYYVAATANGCPSARSSRTVSVLAKPAAPTTTSASRCGTGSITLTASGAPTGGSYRWYIASSGGTAISGATTASYSTPVLSTTTTYYVAIVSSAGCEGNRTAVTATITTLGTPVAVASPSTVSPGGSTTLSVSSPITGATYTWTTSAGLGSATGTSVTATPTATSTYMVTATLNGCTSPVGSVTVQVQTVTAITTSSLTTASFCQGASVSVPFTISGIYNAGNVFTAQLSDATGSFAAPVSIGTLTSSSAGSIAATLPASAVGSAYRVRVISSNPVITGTDNGANLSISSKPTTPTATTAYFCNGSSGSASLTASGGGTGVSAYNWYATATGGTVLYTGATYTTPVVASSTTYYVAAVNASGCESANRRAAMVYVTPAFTVSASATSPSIQSGSSTALTATASATGVTYTWSPATGLSATTGASITASPSVTTTYTLTGTKATCTSTSTVTITVTCAGAMSGSYTVNKNLAASATNFTSFAALASKLNSCGVAGPVTVNVAAGTGPYTEQVEFLQIPGVSGVNTITLNGNGNTLQFAPATATNYLVRLNGTDYFRLQNLVLTSTSTTLGNGIHLYNGAEHNIISGCTINLNVATTAATINGIVASASTTSASTAGVTITDLQLVNNTINGGYYGISLCGDAAVKASGITLTGNVSNNAYFAGAYMFNLDAPQVQGNTIAMRSGGYASGYGLFLSSIDNGFMLQKNVLTGFGRYGMYLTNCNSLTGTVRAQIVNNMIGGGVQNTTAATNGLYLNNTDRLDLWYNSVNLDQGFTNSAACFILASSGGLDVRNNSFAFTGTSASYAFYSPSTSLTSLDYNNYYSTGTKFAYLSADKTDLAGLQAAAGPGGHDLHSYQGNPNYVSATNLHVQAASTQLANRAQVIAGVTTDLDGNSRATSPDIGADEYASPAVHASVSSAASGEEELEIEVYPNPFQTELNLRLTTGSNTPVILTITDALGRVMEQREVAAGESRLNTTQLKAGFYLLNVQQAETSRQMRVIKTQ